MAERESVQRQVEQLRAKLLDLTLRNPMLNHRPSRRYGISIVGEESVHLHRILVEEGKRMSFVGKPDPKPRKGRAEELLLAEDPTALAEHEVNARAELEAYLDFPLSSVDVTDTKLNTDELESVLPAKLRGIQRQAHLAEEEMGINTLFLTLGALEWSETEGKTMRAPLLFLPVQLFRLENGQVRLAHDGGDIGCNLPLRAKLAEHGFRIPEYTDDTPIQAYFSEIATIIKAKADWQVEPNAVALGFFNYEKYAMYMDLGGEAWPEGAKPWQHPDLTAMLGHGYPTADSELSDDTHLDSVRTLEEAHEVYDADSSQTIAIMRAQHGQSMVIEGPPGTGKSQTITNIIAEAVAAGRTVLFVSAKRAALDVVKRRLDGADLGAMCLDLHDKLTNRKEFYAEIKRTANRSISVRDEAERLGRLRELRDRLNQHAEAINEPLAPFGVAPFRAMSILAKLPRETAEDREGRVEFAELQGFTDGEIQGSLPHVEALQARLAETGPPSQHPFWGAQIDYLDPATRLDLAEELKSADARLVEAETKLGEVLRALQIEIPMTAANLGVVSECVRQALAAPPHDGVAMRVDTWRRHRADIEATAKALETLAEVRRNRSRQVKPEIWRADLLAAESAYDLHAEKWYRFLIGDFRTAQKQVRIFLADSSLKPTDIRSLIREVRSAQSAEAEIARQTETMRTLMGVQWQGEGTDPNTVRRLAAWVLDLGDKVESGAIPAGLLDFFAGNTADPTLQARAESAANSVSDALAAFERAAAILKLDVPRRRETPLADLRGRVELWQGAIDRLPAYIAMNEARRQVSQRGLECVARLGDHWPLAKERLRESFLRSYYAGVVQAAIAARPALKAFERNGHENAISEFQRLDDFKLQYNRGRVRLAHQRNKPTFEHAQGNLLLLTQQCELQRKHKPIRWAMARAGEAIQRLKPVFMMSPLSVAIHLPPELPKFDLVVFDEASQIKPEDALCSIIRAKQCIVVGDTRQMPPSSFFDRILEDEEEESDGTAEQEMGQGARQLESVLSLMSSVALGKARRPDLRWHYRSLHPALIQPSNEMFYDNRLVIFPSPGTELGGRRVGVVFHHNPQTVYESGAKRRYNLLEAQIVADAILQHVRERPEQSLMVAAMNKQQADLIYNETLIRERQDPEAFARYREHNPYETLEIKNLENVQGDERDVVFISVTYGRDAQGIVHQRFGPLLSDGGERRLNVLITRARIRCEVFSNMTADDVRSTGRRGVECLRQYLRYAQSGSLDVATLTGRAEESPFEEEVSAALRDHGFEVHTQIGVEGYRIDLGVVDPDRPGAYILGIECDGATYHSARSARDRDKLRQRVLESRGWNLHRIWSTDWWQDREGEIQRTLAAIREAESPKAEPATETPAEPEYVPTVIDAPPIVATPTRPYVALETRTGPLEGYLTQLVAVEGPIHRELLKLRLRNALGYGRAGTRVEAEMAPYIQALARLALQDRDCFFANESQLVQPRDWSSRPASERKYEWVPTAELEAALMLVVGKSYGMPEDDAPRAAWTLLGFRRITANGDAIARAALLGLESAGKLMRGADGLLRVPM